MKKSYLTIFFFVICMVAVMAQIPQAFKYQAVIRDLNGIAIADQQISLKISILEQEPDGNPVYSETHNAITNGMGLVNLEIGRGINPTTNFKSINWTSGEFYILIEMDEQGGTNFKQIGVAQLLAVPFALHAGTADNLSSYVSGETKDGVPSYNWSLFGNYGSNPETDKLGTTDFVDLIMVTDNVERMKIKADGDIDMARSLTIGENLTVKKNVTLNSDFDGGVTTNRGPFTVSDESPTLLSGTLVVDGTTNLNNTLDVFGIANMHSDFNVLEGAPSHMTGTLLVDENATFANHVYINNPDLQSTSPGTGGLVVSGGTGIGKNLYVGGSAFFAGPLAVTSDLESTSPTTGALTVTGGTGIGKRLNVGGATTLSSTLDVNGQVTINANPGNGNQATFNDYPLKVQGGQQGIAIKINGSRSNDNNYVSFWDGTQMWGRIEGETSDNLHSNPEYITEVALKSTDVILYLAESIIGALETGQGVVKLTAAGTSSTACVGLGACITAPVPSLIVESSTNLVLKIANAVVFVANLGHKVADLATFVAFKESQLGVTYQSGAGDYAEWLPKEDPATYFIPGELVGIRNGIVTKNLVNSDKIMIVSTNPIVLGNMPQLGQENNYVRIAFMGQVPVKVLGQVKPGDYILPSELGSGFGKAVSPEKMELKDYKQIAGVAWSDIVNITPGANLVNVAVGINANDLTNVIYKQEEKFKALSNEFDAFKAEMAKSNSILASLVPGYAEATGYKGQPVDIDYQPTQKPQPNSITEDNVAYSNPEDIIYFEISRDQVESSIDLARENYIQLLDNKEELTNILQAGQELKMNSQGTIIMPIEDHPFWKRMDSDPQYKEEIIQYVKNSMEKSYYTQRKYLDKFTDMKIKE